MGRTTDRLGNRRNPLFPHAKELVNGAIQAAGTADAGAFESLLDAKMDTLTAECFEDVIALAYLELRQRKSADEAIRLLVSTARNIGECVQREPDGPTLHLFGVVLRMSGEDKAGPIPPAMQDAVVHAMTEHRLLASDASVSLLPTLLTPGQCQRLLAGDVYALCRALESGNVGGAEEVVQQRTSPPLPTVQPEAARQDGSVVLLVGLAGVDRGTAFPLSTELAAQAETGTSDLQPMWSGYMPQHLLDEMHGKLGEFSAALGSALGATGVLAVQPPVAFAQANMHAAHLQRCDAALAELRRLAQEHGNGLLNLLEVGRPTPGDGGFAVPVHRKVGGKPVAMLRWPVGRYEPPRDALVHLLAFVQSQGVPISQAGAGPTGPLH